MCTGYNPARYIAQKYLDTQFLIIGVPLEDITYQDHCQIVINKSEIHCINKLGV